MDSPPKGNASSIAERALPESLGKYRLMSEIGSGSMGIIYKSIDPHIKRPVAVKTIRRELVANDDPENFMARFRIEAQAAGGLAHPGIVAVYEYGEEGDYAYIAMEYIEGRSLRECFEQKIPHSIAQVQNIMAQLLEALQYAHERGVWHRDIKPGNILIMSNGRVKVTDFGIARIESSMLTQVGMIMGTPGHIAPEMYLGDVFDCRIDVFAAGVILYQLLAGVPPFTGSPEKVMFKVCYETPLPPSVAAHLPALQPLDEVVLKALARRPEDRFASAAEFLGALQQAQATMGRPTGSDETIVGHRPPEPAKELPAPPSTNTLTGAGWDMEALADIEKRLARFVGPIARIMVRRGADQTRDVTQLVTWLAEKISSPVDREQFCAGAAVMAPAPQAPVADDRTVAGRPAVAPAPAPDPLTVEDIAAASRLLTAMLGPIAPIVAKRAAATAGISRQQFISALAAQLSDESDRLSFIKSLAKPSIARRRAND
jgi:serine/threonine-protein kinase